MKSPKDKIIFDLYAENLALKMFIKKLEEEIELQKIIYDKPKDRLDFLSH